MWSTPPYSLLLPLALLVVLTGWSVGVSFSLSNRYRRGIPVLGYALSAFFAVLMLLIWFWLGIVAIYFNREIVPAS